MHTGSQCNPSVMMNKVWPRMRYEMNKQHEFRQVFGDKHANRSEGGGCSCVCVSSGKWGC